MKIYRVASRLLLVAGLCIGGTAAADHDHDDGLVLGDSLAFSYIASVGYEYFYINPENFIGFANDLGYMLDLDVANAGCPGETTGSFLSSTAPDNGCRTFRSYFPLHVDYTSTQLAFATTYLTSHRHVRLVTITLGATDGFLLEASCANPSPAVTAACIEKGAPAVIAAVAGNIKQILADLRGTGYQGAIVLMNYYSLDYSDAAGTALTEALNAGIAAPAAAYEAVVADVFSAFKTVASEPAFGDKTCNTGLLNPDVHNPFVCDVHATQTGHRLIAQTIAQAYRSLDHH